MVRMRGMRWLREHGWVVPGTYVLLAITAGVVLPRIDRANPSLHFLGALAAEQLLAAIAAGMIAFTGIVFSISLIVSQFWSTTYSLRLMQWLRKTPLTGHAFGVFSATFVYALFALAAVGRNEDYDLGSTVAFSLMLLLASVLLFLLLLYSTLRQMNLSYVLSLIGDRGRDVIQAFYGLPGEQAAPPEGRDLDGPVSESGRYVYEGPPLVLAAVDFARLVKLATEAEATIVIEVGVGDSIPSGDVIARVLGGSIPPHEIRRAFLLGTERTMEQDPKFALRLLADVAIKALSPAINDPTTAVQALDQIEDLLLRIGVRTLDIGRLVGVRGYTRVVYPAPTWDDLIALGLDEIRIYGAGSIQVMRRLRNLLQNLETAIPPERRQAVEDRLRRLDAACEQELPAADRADARIPDPQGLGHSRVG